MIRSCNPEARSCNSEARCDSHGARFGAREARCDSRGARFGAREARCKNPETALVPYIPPEKTDSAGDFRERLFLSGRGACLFFLGLFFAVSAFARCVSLQNRGILLEAYKDLKGFSVSGGIGFVLRFYLPQFVCAFAAFLAGFTIFALPVSVVAFAHSQFCLSFFYFALTENAADCGFYKGLAALLYFAFFAAASVLYYSEVPSTNEAGTLRGLLLKGFVCLAYLFAAFFVLRFFSTAFFC